MMKRTALAVLLLASSVAWADSWMPPSRETYVSQDERTRLTVLPRDPQSSYAYSDDKVKGRDPAGASAGQRETSAMALLERRGAAGKWETVWTGPLTNEVAPVEVVVANEGRGFATLDNWYSIGHGSNAVAIYGSDGRLVRTLGLEDFFPDWFVAALPRSVSSINWRGKPRFSRDGTKLILPVVQPGDARWPSEESRTTDLVIRLEDGAPRGLESTRWKKARKDAAIVANAMCASEREWIREWNAPITAPESGEEQDWRNYLEETQYRSPWSDEAPMARTTVLLLESATDFQASVRWLEQALTTEAKDDPDRRAIGSRDLARLTREIERIARRIRPDQLRGVYLTIVADAGRADRIRAALRPSGANLAIVDPKQPLPQVEHRIQHSDPVTCRAPGPAPRQASWWLALPFLALAGGVFLLRRA